ncbi:MAG: hypothetical protein E7462_05135 [Ruminococcaceae bacterium]|nr:hypothetical protein [Oscillospiraceae bacterium]
MKTSKTIIRIVIALAAIAGIVYVVAVYGDRIVAWARKTLGACRCYRCDKDCDNCDCDCAFREDSSLATQVDFEG